jgi:hypothetical protein
LEIIAGHFILRPPHDRLPEILMMFPELTAAIAEAATFNGRHNHGGRSGCDLCAAQRRAVMAYCSELLPTVLSGEWTTPKPGAGTWSESLYQHRCLSDHAVNFRRRGTRGSRSWRNSAVLAQPNRLDVGGVNGEFTPDFLAAARPLVRQGVGVWVSSRLSSYFPGQTALVLVAAGLEPKRADEFGFCAVPK